MNTEHEVKNMQEQYLIPWKYVSIAETARNEGKMHFFFMAGEGYPANPGGNNPEKWGDSCLIAFPDGRLILIDTGMPAYAPVLMENLRRLGVGQLDQLILTHQHDDHTGAVYAEDGILDHLPVSQAWWSGTYNGNWKDPQMLDKIFAAHQVPFQTLAEGAAFDFGRSHLQILSPMADGEPYCYDTEGINDTSIVLKILFQSFSALFTGDIHPGKESELIQRYGNALKADLLKMPHHGNNTSESDQLPNTVSPVIAVATGRDPILDVMAAFYRKNGTTILTDLNNGYIHICTDGKTIDRETSR